MHLLNQARASSERILDQLWETVRQPGQRKPRTYRQQLLMNTQRQHRVDHRIVSLAQPHVRPIVRGKAGTPVEFGAKLAISCVAGFCFIDHLDWEAFNEALDLPQQVEGYKQRFRVYTESVHADQLYRNRANRQWCKDRGISLSDPPLGRPAAGAKADLDHQTRQDARIRNAIEGKFGQGKRRFSLARVMAKLPHTAATSIAITVLVMNLERRLRPLFNFFLAAVRSVTATISILLKSRCTVEALGQLACPSWA